MGKKTAATKKRAATRPSPNNGRRSVSQVVCTRQSLRAADK